MGHYSPLSQALATMPVMFFLGFDCLPSIRSQVKQCQLKWRGVDSWEHLLSPLCAAVLADSYDGSTRNWLDCYYFASIFFGDFNIMFDIMVWAHLGLCPVVLLVWIFPDLAIQ